MRIRRAIGGLLAAAFIITGVAVSADVITDGTFGYRVGIRPFSGELYDGVAGIGFWRPDGYDPIAPGTPRDSWGISLGGVSGFADNQLAGQSNILFSSSVFGPNSGTMTTRLNAGSGNLLWVRQDYSFAAANVLQVRHTVTNTSGGAAQVRFRRNPDWDIVPTPFAEITTADPLWGSVTDGTYHGFQSADPLVPFGLSSGAGGGVFGPGDLGGGFDLDLGLMNNGAVSFFDVFYGINYIDPTGVSQTEAQLRAQIYGLGAGWIVSGVDSQVPGSNSIALGVGPVQPGHVVPEAGSVTLLGSMLGMGGMWLRQRRRIA